MIKNWKNWKNWIKGSENRMSIIILLALLCATMMYVVVIGGKDQESEKSLVKPSDQIEEEVSVSSQKKAQQPGTETDRQIVTEQIDMDEELKKLLTEENMNRDLDRDVNVEEIPFFVPFDQDTLLASYLTLEEHDRLYGQLYWYLSNKGIVDRVLKVDHVDTVKQTDQWTGTFFFHLSYDLPEMPVIRVVCDYDRYKGFFRPSFSVGYGD